VSDRSKQAAALPRAKRQPAAYRTRTQPRPGTQITGRARLTPTPIPLLCLQALSAGHARRCPALSGAEPAPEAWCRRHPQRND
jgi:hypothetical protein